MGRLFSRGALIVAGVVAAGLGLSGPAKAQAPGLGNWQFVLHRLEAMRGGCLTPKQIDYENDVIDTISRYRVLSPELQMMSLTDIDLFKATPAYNRLSSSDKHKVDLITAQLSKLALTASPCGPRVELAVQGNAGESKLPDFSSALQLEYSGVVINPSFGSIERHDTSAGVDVKGSIRWAAGGTNKPARYGAGFYYVPGFERLDFGYHHKGTSGSTSVGSLSTGGNNFNMLSPAGPDGALHGGVTVNDYGIGFANVTGLNSSYDHSLNSGYVGATFSSLKFRRTGTEITPRFKLIFGHQSDSLIYSGMSAAGGLSFKYDNKIDTTSFGGAFGAMVRQRIADCPGGMCWLDAYFDGETNVTEDHASLDGGLTLSGLLNTSETGSASSTEAHVGGTVGGGIEVNAGKAKLRVGGSVEWRQQPAAKYSQSGPVYVDWETSEVISGTARLTVSFK